MSKKLLNVLDKDVFSVNGKVELFPQKGGWFYVRVPKKYTEMTKDLSDRGLVAITTTIGNSSWKTSLLPMGDETQFIALPAKIRTCFPRGSAAWLLAGRCGNLRFLRQLRDESC